MVTTETALFPIPARTHAASDALTRLAVEIGGFSFGLRGESGMRLALDREHFPFVLSKDSWRTCDIEIEVLWANELEAPKAVPLFESGGLWTSYPARRGHQFYFSTASLGRSPYKAAWFDEEFERGHILLRRGCLADAEAVFPLEYPIDELIMTHRLARGEGVEVHAVGLVDRDGRGYLFLGHSGAGKSTTARMWMPEAGVQLLSDDRIIVRKHDDEFWMYGTPWHGDAGIASPGRARVTSIFVLEQSPENKIVGLKPSQAVAELLARSFVPHYIGEGLKFTLGFLEEIAQQIPCSTFQFLPNSSAVEAIRRECA
jgi:hypothetical protein